MKYIYPKLPAVCDFLFFRFGGSGLANCMFIVARAYIAASKSGAKFIAPTWTKFSPGPYIRREKDKRHYIGLFHNVGISGLKKMYILLFRKQSIQTIEGLGNYFEDLLIYHSTVKQYFEKAINAQAISSLANTDFSNVIGIHIRLGDYVTAWRTDIGWYVDVVKHIIQYNAIEYRYFIFSDGTDAELAPLLDIRGVERKFFGNALADIIALSRTKFIVGSDSTFSGWGAFLGQVPVIFPRRHFGKVLIDSSKELILYEDAQDANILENFIKDIV